MDRFILHDPLSMNEAFILPTTPKESLQEAVDQGCSIIKEDDQGNREVITLEEVPEPEERQEITLASADYVDKRIRMVIALIKEISEAFSSVIDSDSVNGLRQAVTLATEAMDKGELKAIEQATQEIAGKEVS